MTKSLNHEALDVDARRGRTGRLPGRATEDETAHSASGLVGTYAGALVGTMLAA
jgi:hypothetical protein